MNEEMIAMLAKARAHLDFVFNRTHQALDVSRAEAKQLIIGYVDLQNGLPQEQRLVPHFQQFLVAAWALNDALQEGEISECGDWIGWALASAIEDKHEVEMHVSRLVDFFDAPPIVSWPGYGPTMAVYFGAFYYYARRRTAMTNVAIECWVLANVLLKINMVQPPEHIEMPEVFAGISMLCWAAKESPERAKELTPLVEKWTDDARLPAWIRSLYCTALSTFGGRFSSHPAKHWAQRALGEFKDQLTSEQQLQMLATICDATQDAEVESILQKMQQHQDERRQRLAPLAFVREAAMRLDVLQPFFINCLALPRTDAAVRCFSTWYQTQHIGELVDHQTLLFTIPFAEQGYSAVLGSKKFEIKRDGQPLLERLSHETDAFLGTAQTVAFADNSALTIPERPGVPAVYAETNWLSTLMESYCPTGVTLEGTPECQLMLPSHGHPVQAVQLLAWGTTWPIAASLSKPKPDRTVACVALWSGGGSMTEAMEIEMLKYAFEAKGAHVEVFSPEHCTPEDFLVAYEDPKYDVFWVASHGEFDHWSPSRVELQIARDRTSVSLEFLHRKSLRADARRLLVLNVCDGGRFEENGMIPRVGLAAGLAGPTQATISHLWPVLGFPSAAFGAFLAHHVAAGQPFFEAYKLAIAAVRRSAADVAVDLRQVYPGEHELIDRLARMDARMDADFAPIQFSGSAAFFQ